MIFTIVWVLAFLALVALIYVGFWLRRRRAYQESGHQESERPPEITAPAPFPRTEEHGKEAVAVKRASLTVQVQEAVYATAARPAVAKNSLAAGLAVESSATMYIHVKARLIPTGKLQLSAIQLLSNGQVLPCADIPECPLETEENLVLHFEAPASSLEPALRQGATLSYVRVTAPAVDVRSNPFVLKPAASSSASAGGAVLP